VLIGVFLAGSIYFNYLTDFEDSFLDAQKGFIKFFCRLIYFSTAYFTTLIITCIVKREHGIFTQASFWIKSILALSLLSLDSSVPFLKGWIDSTLPPQVQYWGYRVAVNLISFFTILLPLFIFFRLYEKNETHLYGLKAKHFDTRPYFQMILIMLPVLAVASFHGSFLKAYPLYRSTTAHTFLEIPELITILGYELAYGLDFITVEFLFRGFMVIGMIEILGRNSILPMAATYCFLHFGKPPGEAISSVIGGYILGVIAYETKSIWGGIIVHLGIAWMMEVIAFTQKSFST
ncbi:MAG TPA: CPBP family intramembrane glutamic endopeptidase, partial [Chryseolinea sp.]